MRRPVNGWLLLAGEISGGGRVSRLGFFRLASPSAVVSGSALASTTTARHAFAGDHGRARHNFVLGRDRAFDVRAFGGRNRIGHFHFRIAGGDA